MVVVWLVKQINLGLVVKIELNDLNKLTNELKESTGIDFSNYAFSSYKRRIERFIEVNKIHRIESLIEKVRYDRDYAYELVMQITVNVTEMFRDPSFWIVLRDNIIPQLNNDRDILNIWLTACSSGEEVYSMAILLKESGLLEKTRLLATDINSKVLRTAKEGIYPVKNMEHNIKNYIQYGGSKNLDDYYRIEENMICFDKSLLLNTDFRCHNLIQDNAPGTFDLILCRNVFIYFNSVLQEKVVYEFSNALTPGSFLGIGSKESISWCKASKYFSEACIEEKIYKREENLRQYQDNVSHYMF